MSALQISIWAFKNFKLGSLAPFGRSASGKDLELRKMPPVVPLIVRFVQWAIEPGTQSQGGVLAFLNP
jgi:hypothetical protein